MVNYDGERGKEWDGVSRISPKPHSQVRVSQDLGMLLTQRRQQGYYRSKHIHTNAYVLICQSFQPYLTPSNLSMLHHRWSAHANEELNKSVSAYAPKDRTFSSTKYLITRVPIAAGVQVTGYHDF